MRQPSKNKIKPGFREEKIKKKKIKQPVPLLSSFWANKKDDITAKDDMDRKKFTVTVSKLEYTFMRNFLDYLGIRYVQQYKLCGFIYDFAILTKDGTQVDALIEVDGDYYHANPKKFNKFLYENQKRQIERDRIKNEVAALNGYVLIRFWEDDIKNHSKTVLKELKKRFHTKSDK